jgi:ubiquinone/menaquinone biosynthesis C-methylase UbiE
VAPHESEPRDFAAVSYEDRYERFVRERGDYAAVGEGPFDLFGRVELGALLAEGLRPTDTLVDLGCGVGRLAVHAIRWLAGGHYIGIDISEGMLQRARERVQTEVPQPSCRVSWIHQRDARFPLDQNSVDMMCAFSVVTHMEHEDSYRYLQEALRVVRLGGRLVLSCLPMDLESARNTFLFSASMGLAERWHPVRSVTTSRELMDAIARLAGWTPLKWYHGEEKNIRLPGTEEFQCLGQSILVLERRSG